jgi:hypothetical protein
MITIATYTFVLMLLLAMDRANRFLAPMPTPSEIAFESNAVGMIRVRAFDGQMNRDLMRWENEGGRIGIDDHKTRGGW